MLKYLSLIPMALSTAQALEAAVPIPGQGKAKLDLLLAIAGEAFDDEEALRTSWGDKAKFQAALGSVISKVVAFLNSAGIFKK